MHHQIGGDELHSRLRLIFVSNFAADRRPGSLS
jgi:hypothetical protein